MDECTSVAVIENGAMLAHSVFYLNYLCLGLYYSIN